MRQHSSSRNPLVSPTGLPPIHQIASDEVGMGPMSRVDWGVGLIEQNHLSYSLSEIISQKVRPQYVIIPHLLERSSISQLHRATIRFWLYEIGFRMELDRLVVATASHFIDMYLSRGTIQLKKFSTLAVAALLLANKTLSSEKKIDIDNCQVPHLAILEMERKMCSLFNFRLHPITYIHAMEELILLWNTFASKHRDLWKYNQPALDGRSFGCVEIYELLDIVFMAVKTFTFDLLAICIQVFRLFLRIDYQFIESIPKSIEDEVIINFWCNPEDQPLLPTTFEALFEHYLHFIAESSPDSRRILQLSPSMELEDYLRSFFAARFGEFLKRQLITTKTGLDQAFNPLGLQIAKNFFRIKKNNRKGSSETACN